MEIFEITRNLFKAKYLLIPLTLQMEKLNPMCSYQPQHKNPLDKILELDNTHKSTAIVEFSDDELEKLITVWDLAIEKKYKVLNLLIN